MSILEEIVSNKKKEVSLLKEQYKRRDYEKGLAVIPPPRDFQKAISIPLSLIAEVKRASPSLGIIKKDFNPVKIAVEYEKSGVNAISVLTDKEYFKGDIKYLNEISKQVKIPVLRKDFIIDELQVFESRLNGADAILLIVKILSDKELKLFSQRSKELGLAQIVEVHDEKDILRALKISPEIIGINNRNLETFEIDLDTTFHLLAKIPKDLKALIVSESGIKTEKDISRLRKAGINAVLIGEELMKSGDAAKKIKKLFKW